MHDDLFSPTIREQPAPGRPPWRPESIVYPAFFGGPLAAATLGVLNGRRLALPTGHLLAIAGAGLAGFAARAVVEGFTDGNSPTRLAGTVTGLLVWLVVLSLQRRPFRVVALRGHGPARLLGPGFAAAIGCGLLEAILLVVLVR
ncbi:hypothetical protein [Paractinoplanes maris]|uniref:hypothetical protein n=1 Tax=Paractinoplanes maris TaxID=1734446 RepID=UPI0020227416|nr:hypothetical protein [Actinoplanes maris]